MTGPALTFFSLLYPHRVKIYGVLACILAANLCTLAFPWAIKVLIDDIFVNQDFQLLNRLMMSLVFLIVARAGFHFSGKASGYVMGERIMAEVRERIYWRVQVMSLREIRKATPAQVLTRLTSDVESLRRFMFGEIIDSVYAFLSIALITGILLWINPRLTLVSVCALPVFVFFYLRHLSRLKEGYSKVREGYGRLVSRASEVLHGMNIVRGFGAGEYEKNIFSARQKDIISIARENHFRNTGLWTGVELFTSAGIIAVLWVGGRDVLAQRMSTGELVAFYSYLGMLFAPVIRLTVLNSFYQEAAAGLKRVNEIFEKNVEPAADPSPVVLRHITGHIRFENVSFGYCEQKKVLNNISFCVEAGQKVGIVGVSGAGKTTLVSLLLRSFDPQEGRIYVDGQPLTRLDTAAYRKHIGVALQDDYLFSTSVRDNLIYGSFEAGEEEVQDAARLAAADGFIRRLPSGYDTLVGDRGTHLSSGQRQRIALARALLKRPSILILDEATSAIDALTENIIQKSVRERMKDKTVFVIAHRFSTIMDVDKIIVLKDGKIEEEGEHNYLLKKGGFYSSLYYEQFKESYTV